MFPWDTDAPAIAKFINMELSLTKGNNSRRHDAIWAILKLEGIMVLNNVTKFHGIIIKTFHLKKRHFFHKQRAITP